MRSIFRKKAAPPQVDLGALLARVQQNGHEAGWTGSDEWSPLVGDLLRSELRLLLSRQAKETPLCVDVLAGRQEKLCARKADVDAQLALVLGRLRGVAEPAGAAVSLVLNIPRAIAIGALIGITGLVAGGAGVTMGARGWVVLVLAGVLLQLRPWGVAAGVRSALAAALAGGGYLRGAWRSAALARRIDQVERALERETLRREQSERWVAERLEWLFSEYLFAKGRGDKARLMAAQA
jgi:hypothetical protein